MHKGQSQARAIKRGNVTFDSSQGIYITKKEGKKYFLKVQRRNAKLGLNI